MKISGIIFYYICEFYIVYLVILGTWRIAQSTNEGSDYGNIYKLKKSEDNYIPWRDLNPLKIFTIAKWFFHFKYNTKGVAGLVILKKQFDWGLRFLIGAITLQYVITKLKGFF